MKSYIIEVVKIDKSDIREAAGTRIEWVGTAHSLAEANAEFDAWAQKPNILAVALLEWQCGAGGTNKPLEHYNTPQRNCDGGIPTQRVLRHGTKEWIAPHDQSKRGIARDWREHPESVGVEPTTQPSPGHKLKARIFRGYCDDDGVIYGINEKGNTIGPVDRVNRKNHAV